jgi:hypothetical protein
MLTQAPDAEPRLRGPRHAALLAAAILAVAMARSTSVHVPIALAFACYGALHAAAVALCLRPRAARWRALAFVAAAALLSGSLARLGLLAAPLLARRGVQLAASLVVALCAFAGALGYGALLRSLLGYRLARGPLVMIAVACLFAASAALVLMWLYPVGGSAWIAILWWLAFSAGLGAEAGRYARLAREPPDAPRQRMP